MASRRQKRAARYARDPTKLSDEDLVGWVEHRLKKTREPSASMQFASYDHALFMKQLAAAASVPEPFFDPSLIPKQGRWVRQDAPRGLGKLKQRYLEAWPEANHYVTSRRIHGHAHILVEKPKPALKDAHPGRRGFFICLGNACAFCSEARKEFKKLQPLFDLALDYATLEIRCLAALQGAKKEA